MKFAEFPYERPDLQAAMAQLDALSRSITSATTAEEAKNAFLSFEKITERIGSLSAICYIRHTVDTRDPFYEKENAFWDENLPLFTDRQLDIYRAMVFLPASAGIGKRTGEAVVR